MELQEFIEKFLPNLKEREKEFCKNYGNTLYYDDGDIDSEWYNYFSVMYFPEALQNFADKICEKQRENCARAANFQCDYCGREQNINDIKNSEQPKIEEV